MLETEIVRCNLCGAPKRNVNDECIACRELFQLTPAPVQPAQPIAKQIYGTPLNEYTMPLANGKSIDVHIYGVDKIVAYLKDINGTHVHSEEFNDITKFKETVKTIKEQIENELSQLETFKKVFDELGFISTSE
jgi:hypothetical protein